MNQRADKSSELRLLRRQLGSDRQVCLRWEAALTLNDRTPNSRALLDVLSLDLSEGSLMEVLSRGQGTGASTWAFRMACQLQRFRLQGARLPVVVVDAEHEFFPPGADRLGLSLSRTVVVRPSRHEDVLWTLEQSLRSQAGSIVVCRIERITATVYRRLKLAAERGRSRGLLLRPARYQSAASWADVRLLVEPHPLPRSTLPHQSRRLRLEVLHLKGRGFERQASVMDISDETSVVSVVAELADPTAAAESA